MYLFPEFVVELRIQWTWNDDLENENSEAFKELSQILVMQARIKQHLWDGISVLATLPFS